MGVKERRQRERTEVRETILDAALEFFANEGVEGVTMRALADAIEYSPPVIYSHFRDKDALIRELCNRQLRALAKEFAKLANVADPVERLRGIGRVYVDFALEHPSHFRFMFLTPHAVQSDEERDAIKGDPEQDAYAFLRQTVEAAVAAHAIRPEFTDAEEITQMCWAAAHGVVALQNVKHADNWIEWRDARTTAYKLLDAMLEGITCTNTDAHGAARPQSASRAVSTKKRPARG